MYKEDVRNNACRGQSILVKKGFASNPNIYSLVQIDFIDCQRCDAFLPYTFFGELYEFNRFFNR